MIECFVDGSFRPEASCSAVVIYEFQQEKFRTVKPIITSSNVAAEAEAILLAINLCYVADFHQPTIYTDSLVIRDQFYRERRVRSRSSHQYLLTMWELHKVFPFTIKHVPRKLVFVADDLCNEWMNTYKENMIQK